jgi:hypothetical protein
VGIDINSTGEEGSLACAKTMLGVFCLKHCEIYENHMVLSYFDFNGRLKRMRIVLGKRPHGNSFPSAVSQFFESLLRRRSIDSNVDDHVFPLHL